MSVSLVRDTQERPLYFVSQIEDITKRKQFESSLRENEERFRMLAAASPVGIFRTDKERHGVYANQRWVEIAGLSLEESLGGRGDSVL